VVVVVEVVVEIGVGGGGGRRAEVVVLLEGFVEGAFGGGFVAGEEFEGVGAGA
jgi:hypothetical protein